MPGGAMSALEKVLRLAADAEPYDEEEEAAALIRAAAGNLNELALLLAGDDDGEGDDDDEDEDDDESPKGKKPFPPKGKGKAKGKKGFVPFKKDGKVKASALVLDAMTALSCLQGGEEAAANVRARAGALGLTVSLSCLEAEADPETVVMDLAAAPKAGAPAAGAAKPYHWLPLKQFEAAHPFKNSSSAAPPRPPAARSGAVGPKTPGPSVPRPKGVVGPKPGAPRTGAARPKAPGARPAGRFSGVQHKWLSQHQWHQAHLAHLAHMHRMHLDHLERMGRHP